MLVITLADMVGTVSITATKKVNTQIQKMGRYQRNNWMNPITAVRTANTPAGRSFIKSLLIGPDKII